MRVNKEVTTFYMDEENFMAQKYVCKYIKPCVKTLTDAVLPGTEILLREAFSKLITTQFYCSTKFTIQDCGANVK